MFKIISVTNRHLCPDNFLHRIEQLACHGIDAVILREKDLPEVQYEYLAKKALQICDRYQVPCVLHHFTQVARNLGANRIHLSLPNLQSQPQVARQFATVGVSVHSLGEAQQAEALGATYLMAGHVFQTDCKKGLPPRGISFLEEICQKVALPVYAVGGISPANIGQVKSSGAAGGCLMSTFMACPDIPAEITLLRKSGALL